MRAWGQPARWRSTINLRANTVVRALRCDMEGLLWPRLVRQTHPPRPEALPSSSRHAVNNVLGYYT